jgi:hypothetical protein
MRRVEVWIPADGDPQDAADRLRRSPKNWLPERAEERGPGLWRVTLRAGPVSRTATCGVGHAVGAGADVSRRLVWSADPEPSERGERALPQFEGTIAVHAIDERRGTLRLEGSYEPPSGAIGASYGPAQLRVLAEAVAAHFLDDVAARLMGDDEADEEAGEETGEADEETAEAAEQ